MASQGKFRFTTPLRFAHCELCDHHYSIQNGTEEGKRNHEMTDKHQEHLAERASRVTPREVLRDAAKRYEGQFNSRLKSRHQAQGEECQLYCSGRDFRCTVLEFMKSLCRVEEKGNEATKNKFVFYPTGTAVELQTLQHNKAGEQSSSNIQSIWIGEEFLQILQSHLVRQRYLIHTMIIALSAKSTPSITSYMKFMKSTNTDRIKDDYQYYFENGLKTSLTLEDCMRFVVYPVKMKHVDSVRKGGPQGIIYHITTTTEQSRVFQAYVPVGWRIAYHRMERSYNILHSWSTQENIKSDQSGGQKGILSDQSTGQQKSNQSGGERAHFLQDQQEQQSGPPDDKKHSDCSE